MTEQSKIAKKIAQIIAKAESTTSPEEAAVFMEKARAMMEQHGLDLLALGTLEEDDPVGVEKAVHQHNESYSWMRIVINQLAVYYGCRIVVTTGLSNQVSYSVAGRLSARETFKAMLPFVVKQVRQLASAGVKGGKYASRGKATNLIGSSLALRLAELAQEQRESEMGRSETGVALVAVDQVEAAMADAFGPLGKAKSRSVRTNDASRADAQRVSLYRQTSGTARKQLT